MRLIFAGTPAFACTALQRLAGEGFDLALVLTQPDRPAGRGMQLHASPVKLFAQGKGIPVAQPRSLRLQGKFPQDAQDARRQIVDAQAQCMVVAAYGLVLPQWLLDLMQHPAQGTGFGCLNIHASLLPRWRGAAPIHRAIMAGDAETGVCIMQMAAGLDTGPMLLRESIAIAVDDTTATLHDKLANLGGKLIVNALDRLQNATLLATPQPDASITYAEKISKAEALIDWNGSAEEIERRVRAFNPFPIAQTVWRSEPLRVWKAELSGDENQTPGTIIAVEKDRIIVACHSGALALTELQRAGGKRLAAREFLHGITIQVGDRFGD